MKQTIVVVIDCCKIQSRDKIEALSNDRLIKHKAARVHSLKDFQEMYNDEFIDFENTLIRFIEAELEVKACT